MRTFWNKFCAWLRVQRLKLAGDNPTIGEILNGPKPKRDPFASARVGGVNFMPDEDPDAEFDALKNPVLNPIIAFNESVRDGKKFVDEAWLFEAHFDERGKMLRDPKALEAMNPGRPKPYLIRHVRGTEAYKRRVNESFRIHNAQPAKSRRARETAALKRRAAETMAREGFLNTDFLDTGSGYDPNQYTEFAPAYGGPFFKQLYLFDYLKQHSYAFEAWNHNPLAKRIVELLSQYSLGRRFTMRIDDPKKEKAWKAFDEKHRITEKVCEFWANEALIYGELMVDTDTWNSVDPSTVWDIITDPDDITDVYYYYQSYPTAFQQFTGYAVKGAPGSKEQPAQKYILRQIPADKMLHMKLHCVSNEKRGRSVLFPALGWMKRVKDLYNAQVIREWLMSSFVWDVTLEGNQADVDAYAASHSTIPLPGSTDVHNKTVERKPMAAMTGGTGNAGGSDIADSLLSFIAASVGVPKEFFNVVQHGGGSRAQALTTAEPFTKVIEDLQAKWESFLREIFKRAIQQAGMDYEDGDVEVLFPSVTKDTTSETIQNIEQGETMGYISKRTASEMYAKEMNITKYDFEDEQKKAKNDEAKGLTLTGSTPPPGAGRFGRPGMPDETGSEIHGAGKNELVDQLKNL